MIEPPDLSNTVPFFTSVTVTGVTVVRVVTVAVPRIPDFQLVDRQLLSVDGEAEVVGNRELLRPLRQPDDQLVAVDGQDFKPLGLRRR